MSEREKDVAVESKDRTLWVAEDDIDRLQWMVKRYAARAEINKNVSPHTLRHSFAIDLYRETSKIRLVQKVLGHSDLSTTMIYTHIFEQEADSSLKSFRQAAAV